MKTVANAAKEVPKKIAKELFDGYAQDTELLPNYATLLAVYGGVISSLLLFLKKENRLPERFALRDLLLLALATHKLSRVIALDKIAMPLRAPFTKFEKATGAAEVDEEPRGRGMRRAIGSLISCPYCIEVWISTGLSFGLAAVPRVTRFVASIFGVVAVSDFLHRCYVVAKEMEPPKKTQQ